MNTDDMQEESAHDKHMRELGEWKISPGTREFTGAMRFANGRLQQRFVATWVRWDGALWRHQNRATWEAVPDVMVDLSEPDYEVVN